MDDREKQQEGGMGMPKPGEESGEDMGQGGGGMGQGGMNQPSGGMGESGGMNQPSGGMGEGGGMGQGSDMDKEKKEGMTGG
jgi:hypothetical protein